MTEKKGAAKISQKKADTVAQLADKLAKAKAFFLTDYRGLSHQQLETLKKTLKKVEGELLVAKNTMIRIAMQQCNPSISSGQAMKQLEPELKNPTAAFLSYGDEISAIKILANFIKTTQLPKIKIGFFAGNVATEADFQKLSNLPTRDILLATLVNRLQSPIYGLHRSLNWNLQRLVTVFENLKIQKSNVKSTS